MNSLLKQGLEALESQDNELALALLRLNANENTGDATSLFWCACAHDRLGLELLLECSGDESISRYSKAIGFYASRLSEQWE